MRSKSFSRALRLGVGAVAGAVIAAGSSIAPAVADEESDQLWINAPYEVPVLTAPADGPAAYRDVFVSLYHDNDHFTVTDGRLSVDASGLAGVAEVAWPESCSPSGVTAVCEVPEVASINDEDWPGVTLRVRAAAGAAAGVEGRITYEAEATGGPEGRLVAPTESAETTVRVASGPDLVVKTSSPEGVVPGDTVTLPFAVTNEGNEPARGFTLWMVGTYGLDFPERFPGCTYRDPDLTDGYIPMTTVDCAFDTVLEPGDTVELPEPLRIAAKSFALAERVDMRALPADGAVDANPSDNYAIAGVAVRSSADFAVRGAEVTAAAGETVQARVRFRNRGPAWVANSGSGDPVARIAFYVPEGAKVTTAPSGCRPRTLTGGYYQGTAGAPRYDCTMPMWVTADAVRDFVFTLRVETVVPDAAGRLELTSDYGGPLPFDPKDANNRSAIVVNPSV
ncbi:hypothetical protein [Streptomyces sp. NPDC047130]|uniref:hypothetical protein n=1 Tax=Streptomyces sp. NPDC047130 TaxID=3155261 RepID=UPI0033DDAFB3